MLSSLHKAAYFYDVGTTCAIDQKINHLHNDRVANMWRNNVPTVCGEDSIERGKTNPGHLGTDLDILVLGPGHFGTDLDIAVLDSSGLG